jgi:hypothetical protein
MKTLISELKLWKIEEEDGASHTIVAENDAQALGLWLEHFIMRNGDDTCPDKLPSIEPYGRSDSYTFAPWGDERKLTASAGEWVTLFGRAAYLGCSDY